MTLTQQKASKMNIHQKHAAYLSHEFNTTQGKGKSIGPTVAAQTRLHNNWQRAIDAWIWSLPVR